MVEQDIFGTMPDRVLIRECGLQFYVNIRGGQKTGFFLDQREMRQWVRTLADGKRVLNCFSYTGGFSVAARAGGATHVDSVDISDEAISLVKENITLNPGAGEHRAHVADVFEWLRAAKGDCADIIILDPRRKYGACARIRIR